MAIGFRPGWPFEGGGGGGGGGPGAELSAVAEAFGAKAPPGGGGGGGGGRGGAPLAPSSTDGGIGGGGGGGGGGGAASDVSGCAMETEDEVRVVIRESSEVVCSEAISEASVVRTSSMSLILLSICGVSTVRDFAVSLFPRLTILFIREPIFDRRDFLKDSVWPLAFKGIGVPKGSDYMKEKQI